MIRRKEYFYTERSFRTAGIEPYTEHVRQYLCGQRTIPVSKTQNHYSRNNSYVYFTFSDTLLYKFLEQPDSIKKPYEVALKYGFRGYSAGGKNGIFLLRESDGGLIEAVERLALEHEYIINEDLDLQENGLDALRKVKIVWHNPSGERVVGVYNTNNGRIIFLDFAHY